jgi:addiction module HigA family antidote
MIELKVRYSAGELLKIMVLEERELTQKWLAEKLGCAERKISEICNNKRGISADFALQLESVFDMSAEMWVTMQAKWELSQARKNAA